MDTAKHPPAFAWLILGALGALNLVRGWFHFFAADGGSGSVAGLDLTTNAEAIIFIFAVLGLQQFCFGLIDIWIALRARALVLLMLGLEFFKQAASVFVIYVYKPPPVLIPGRFMALFLTIVLGTTLFAALMLRRRQ